MDETPADKERNDRYALGDLIHYAKRAIGHCAICPSREAFELDMLTQDAASWCITVIGEAARRLSQDAKDRIAAIPWQQVIQMRNRMIHEYHRVQIDIVWKTVQGDLAPLIRAVEADLRSRAPQTDESPEPAGPS